MISTDQSGQISITSALGNRSIKIINAINLNLIDDTSIKPQKKEELIKGYNKIYNDIATAGITSIIRQFNQSNRG